MNFHLWLGFVAASLVMGLIPGPGVMSIVGYAIGSGRKTALASVAGMALGNVTAMTLSLAGVGAVLAASALAFSILKWAGALYLIALGIAAIARAVPGKVCSGFPSGTATKQRTSGGGDGVPKRSVAISPRAAFAGNVAVGTFHPKTIIFFVAFAPQFIGADANYAVQAAILIATFGLVVGCTDTLYALGAAKASRLLAGARAGLWSKRLGGGVLIAAGLATAAMRK